jgi:4-carboxymuconolactone decarboxylase
VASIKGPLGPVIDAAPEARALVYTFPWIPVDRRNHMEVEPVRERVTGSAERFTGDVQVETITLPYLNDSPVTAAVVRFAPAARSAWHAHAHGQTLRILDGVAVVCSREDGVIIAGPGQTVHTPPGQWHWHGAVSDDGMSHLALSGAPHPPDGPPVTWGTHVTDAEYQSACSTDAEDRPTRLISKEHTMTEQTPAQRAIGDFAPKLVDLTDNVLFGDVWSRPELSRRDRSLVTVASLVTSSSFEQLTNHLRLAKQNGLTEDELKEAIIHLAFYAGWPKAMSAIQVAKRVFTEESQKEQS